MPSSLQPAREGRASRGLPPFWAAYAAAGLLLGWVGWLVYISRWEMLDDALIHLRFAAMLRERGFISYDGIHRSYGASSLLYVALLGGLRCLTQSSLLPKAVSLAGYGGLLVTLVGLQWRVRASGIARGLAVGAILAVSGPMGVRWLTDGMETSLVALTAAWLAIGCAGAAYGSLSRSRGGMLFLLAAAVVGLRVDLALLVGVAAYSIAAGRLQRGDEARRALLAAVPVASGGGLALAAVGLAMGHVLPDTALAKMGGSRVGVVITMAHVLASAGSLGLGTVALWIASFAFSWRAHRQAGASVWETLAPNSVFPVLYAGAILRGQQLQGVRYVLWALLFSLVWNVVWLYRFRLEARPAGFAGRPGLMRSVFGVMAVMFVVAYAVELPAFIRIAAGRGTTYRAMRAQPLGLLAGQGGVAADVGFLGYFTRGQICDLDGLINGRTAAAMPEDARAAHCVQQGPAFAFLSAPQMGYLAQFQPWAGWDACEWVDFTNAGSADRHFLLLRRGAGRVRCAQLTDRGPLTRRELAQAGGPELLP